MVAGLPGCTDCPLLVSRRGRSARLGAHAALLLALVFGAQYSAVANAQQEGAAAQAQPVDGVEEPPAVPTERAILTFYVGDERRGDIEVVLRGGDVLAPVVQMRDAGLEFSGDREIIEGIAHVSMASLVSDLAYNFDLQDLTLRVTRRQQLKEETVIDLQHLYRPEDINYSKDASMFLNYAGRAFNFKRFEGLFEAGISVQGHLLFSDFKVNQNGKFIRGLSNATFDTPNALLRVIAGDTFTAGDALGGGLFIGGAKVERQFSLDPYFVRFPSFGLSGAVEGESTLDVYVDGRRVRSEQVQPGTFNLQNIPVVRGAGATQVVVRDAFGREQTISSPYYFSTGILKPGLQEFSYAVGYRRNRIGMSSWDYDMPSLQGTHRFGITDWVTAGLRVEGSDDMINGGGSATFRLPYGEFEVTGAASHESGRNGGAAAAGYTYLSKPFSAGGMFRYQSDEYSHLSLPAVVNRTRFEGTIFGAMPIGTRVNLTVQYSAAKYRDGQRRDRVGALSLIRLGRRTSLITTAAYNRVDSSDRFEAFIQLTHFFGLNTTAAVSHTQSGRQRLETLQVQKPLELGRDYGFRAELQEGQVDRAFLLGQYQTEFGLYELSYERASGENNVVATASGGLVIMGGGVHPSRALFGSYTLIQVPGIKGVRGYLNNFIVGKTNRRGNLLVPNTIAYYANRISIADEDVPLQYELSMVETAIAPPFRGGAVARFDLRKVQPVTGVIVIKRGGTEIVPAYGELTVTLGDREIVSPIGRDGEFYFDEVPVDGTFRAKVEHEEATCEFDLMLIPSGNLLALVEQGDTVVDVGTKYCTASDTQPPEEGAQP